MSFYLNRFKNSFFTDILEIFNILQLNEEPNNLEDHLSLQVGNNEPPLILDKEKSNSIAGVDKPSNNSDSSTKVSQNTPDCFETTNIINDDQTSTSSNIEKYSNNDKLMKENFDPYLVTFHGPDDQITLKIGLYLLKF